MERSNCADLALDQPAEQVTRLCWICRARLADSAEHRINKSDLRSFTGNRPFFFHDEANRNVAVRSLNAPYLKYDKILCTTCNTTVTQPHDYAWQEFASILRSRRVGAKSAVALNSIYGTRSQSKSVALQLFFAKKIGCAVASASSKVDVSALGDAIIQGNPCDGLALALMPPRMLGGGPALHETFGEALCDRSTLKLTYAEMAQHFEWGAVHIVYDPNAWIPRGSRAMWQPGGPNRLPVRRQIEFRRGRRQS